MAIKHIRMNNRRVQVDKKGTLKFLPNGTINPDCLCGENNPLSKLNQFQARLSIGYGIAISFLHRGYAVQKKHITRPSKILDEITI